MDPTSGGGFGFLGSGPKGAEEPGAWWAWRLCVCVCVFFFSFFFFFFFKKKKKKKNMFFRVFFFLRSFPSSRKLFALWAWLPF